MPIFKVDILKRWVPLQYEYTNVYYVNADTITDAHNHGVTIMEAERSIHLVEVIFDKVRTSVPGEEDDQFISQEFGIVGTRPNEFPYSEPLPIFNVLLVKLGSATGRNAVKYFRGILREADIAGHVILPSLITFVQDQYVATVSGVPLVKPNGTTISNYSVSNRVGNRQLRRGSKRNRVQLP